MTNYKEIDDYIRIVRKEEHPVCREQKRLCDYVEKVFREENLYIDEGQMEKYLALQKYFPFRLFPWEVFLFVLHNCVYREDGFLRWPELFMMVGRGTGKNGYLAFEDFALLTPVNGIKEYHIDIFANCEDQAMMSFKDVWEMLESHEKKMSRFFSWNKEIIRNRNTRSEFRFRTSNAKTKDGGRPGKVDFDEYHQYENYKTIEVAKTGLGKKQHPRITIITTDGDVRDGPLDHALERADGILKGILPDNGFFPFICRLDDEKEVDDERMWHKANPSLRYFPTLLEEMRREYADYVQDKIGNRSFLVKRMNCHQGEAEAAVTSWENILAACREVPDLTGMNCVAGIDYAKTDDFVAAGLLFERDGVWYWITHTWVCARNQASLSRIRFPLKDAERRGLLTMVDEVEILPRIPAEWLEKQAEKYNIICLAIDNFRHTLLAKELERIGFETGKGGNVELVKKPEIMKMAPVIASQFANRRILWGKNELMRWYTWNTKQIMNSDGNISYGKIEPKSRKTDGFMALAAAATRVHLIEGWNRAEEEGLFEVCIY